MITRVSLKNFKLHADTTIDAAPITVFIGPNNSGKSSIFQALLSLKQASSIGWDVLYPPDRRVSEHPIIDIGGFEDVVRHGEREIQIRAEGTVSNRKNTEYGREIKVNLDIRMQDNWPVHHRGSLRFDLPEAGAASWIITNLRLANFDRLEWEWVRDSIVLTPSIELENIPSKEKLKLLFAPVGQFRLIQASGTQGQFPPERMLEATEFQQFLAGVPKALFAELHPICPLRGFEEWGYPLPEAPAPNLDRLSLTERAVALASVLAYNRDIEKALSQWLEDLIEVRIEVKLLPGKRVTIRCKPSSSGASDNLFLNEGTGASQLPFILIPIGLAHRNETILLSEPEAHLHPRLQSHLMQALLGIAKRETKQFLIETHSEHVLHVLLNAVAKGDLQKSELAIYYFENVNGEAKVRRLEVNEHGQVEGGLPGFFDQSLAELTEYLEALKKS